MTDAQGQTAGAKRSRILGSIFARTPRDTSASSDPRFNFTGDQSIPKLKDPQQPPGWRDVTARLARETLAESICRRFFVPAEARAAGTVVPEGSLITAGQRLEALSTQGESAPGNQNNVAALAKASAHPASGKRTGTSESAGARLRSQLTAKAA